MNAESNSRKKPSEKLKKLLGSEERSPIQKKGGGEPDLRWLLTKKPKLTLLPPSLKPILFKVSLGDPIVGRRKNGRTEREFNPRLGKASEIGV